MVKLSSDLIKQKVLLMNFEGLKLEEQYDGIWACSSLLHVNRKNIVDVISELSRHLKETGVFYMSFKYGDNEYEKDGRYFNCFDEESFKAAISKIPELSIKRINKTVDVRPGRDDEYWLNCYLIKN
jgi:SAM-dependent methyltransferase